MGELGTCSVIVVLLTATLDCVVGEYCRERFFSHYYNDYRYREIHCTWGCCGSDHYDEYCCVSNAGIIVGIVFAAIFGIAIITAAVCCILKHKSNRGRVVRPSAHPTATVVGPPASGNVFIVPTGPAPPPYSATVYPANPYGSYPMAPSAPMPPAYPTHVPGPSNYGDPNHNPVYPPAYSTLPQPHDPFKQNANAAK